MRRVIPAAAAVLLTAACSSGATQSAPTPSVPAAAAPSSPAPSPSTLSASPRPAGQPAGAGNISRSTQARHLPPGPFRITPVKCGPYTAAEQSRLGTTAKGGLIFKYTNVSNTLTDAVKLDVGFTSGSTVEGENVNGGSPKVAPGQSAEAAVDALGGSGTNLTFTACQLNTYSLMGTPAAGSYAP